MLQTKTPNFNFLPLLIDKVPEILNALNLNYDATKNGFQLKCPIHDSFQKKCFIYVNDSGVFWKCYTRGCEERYGRSLIGLISGIKQCSYLETQKWLSETFLINAPEYDSYESLKRFELIRFTNKEITKTPQITTTLKSISKYLGDQDYFLKRGFTKEILDKYHVGKYLKKDSIVYQRYVIPLLEEDGQTVIGLTGRSSDDKKGTEKWVHAPQHLDLSSFFFNINFAKPFIEDSGTVVLVEGCGDVMKLEQAGIHNSLAIMGLHLKKTRKLRLIRCGVHTIYLLLDNDEPGITAKERLKENLRKDFRIIVPKFPGKDIGELNETQIKEIFS